MRPRPCLQPCEQALALSTKRAPCGATHPFVQIQHILVGILKADSYGKSAAILSAENPSEILHNHEAGQLALLKPLNNPTPEVKKELEDPAEKRVQLDLIFSEIAKAENIAEGSHEDEERLLKVLTSQGVDEGSARNYLKTMLIREKIWEALGAESESRV